MVALVVTKVATKVATIAEADEFLGFRVFVQNQPTSARLAGPSVFSSAAGTSAK